MTEPLLINGVEVKRSRFQILRRKYLAEEADAVRRYTQGLCGEFARALSRLTGWKVFILHDLYLHAPIRPHWELGCLHAICQRPDGMYVDVEGVRTEEEVRKRWMDEEFCRAYGVTIGFHYVEDPEHDFPKSWILERTEVARARRYILKHLEEYRYAVEPCVPTGAQAREGGNPRHPVPGTGPQAAEAAGPGAD